MKEKVNKKGRGMWKRLLCIALTVGFLPILPGTALGAQNKTAAEWTYGNSILITVFVGEEQGFKPEDFPGINCSSICIVGKSVTKEGIVYELVLTLKNGNEAEMERAINGLKQFEIVETVQRNEKFAPPESTISLNKSVIYLKKGDTAHLSIQDVNLVENSFQNIGIKFSVNPELYDEDTLNKDSFLSYGVSRFWPDTEKGEEILIERPDALEATKSEDHIYYGLAENDDSLFSTADTLAALPGITSVSIVQMAVPGGEPPYEEWTVNKTELIDLELSGGNIAEGFGQNGPRLNQTAAIKGKNQGTAVVRVDRGAFGAYASAGCRVIVYEPGSKNNLGDMNHNGTIDTDDVLQVLKHSSGLVSLNEADKETADIDQNGNINTDDALLVLEIIAGAI